MKTLKLSLIVLVLCVASLVMGEPSFWRYHAVGNTTIPFTTNEMSAAGYNFDATNWTQTVVTTTSVQQVVDMVAASPDYAAAYRAAWDIVNTMVKYNLTSTRFPDNADALQALASAETNLTTRLGMTMDGARVGIKYNALAGNLSYTNQFVTNTVTITVTNAVPVNP